MAITKTLINTFIYELKCVFCGAHCGELELSKDKHQEGEVTNDDLNILDIRCDKCREERGVFNKE